MIIRILLVVEDSVLELVYAPIMMVKACMMIIQKLMLIMMIKYLKTQWVDHKDPENLGLVVHLKDPKYPWNQWPLSYVFPCQMHYYFEGKDNEDAESHCLHIAS